MVLDPNVLISAAIAPGGAPNRLLRAVAAGRLELVISPNLVQELEDVLVRPKFRNYLSRDEVVEFVVALSRIAILQPDPPFEPGLTPDPDDDYLVALARASGANILVSGDPHLTGLEDPDPPVMTPRQFLESIE